MPSKYTPEEVDEILARSRENLRIADEMLAGRKDPNAWENIIKFTPRRQPEPPPQAPRTFTDAEVAQLIQRAAADLRQALESQREEILDWTEDLLIKTTRHYLDEFCSVDDKIISLRGEVSDIKRRKSIEGDVAEQRADIASLRADLSALQSTVEMLASRVATLSDDIASI